MFKKWLTVGVLLVFSLNAKAQTSINSHCKIKFEGTDPSIDQYVKEIEPEQLFIFTPDAFKSMLVEYPLVEGAGALISTGGYTYFELKLKVNSSRARKDYGYVEKGSIIKFYLLDGTSFYSNNLSSSMPQLSEDRKATNYVLSCALEKDEIKMLNKSYIDKIGVIWSKGYEEYEFYNPDFFVNQLYCIQN